MLEEKIRQIIIKNLELRKPPQDFSLDLKLADIGVDSITFIKIIVDIEAEFKFEFGNEDLDYHKYPNLGSLVSYVQSKLS